MVTAAASSNEETAERRRNERRRRRLLGMMTTTASSFFGGVRRGPATRKPAARSAASGSRSSSNNDDDKVGTTARRCNGNLILICFCTYVRTVRCVCDSLTLLSNNRVVVPCRDVAKDIPVSSRWWFVANIHHQKNKILVCVTFVAETTMIITSNWRSHFYVMLHYIITSQLTCSLPTREYEYCT